MIDNETTLSNSLFKGHNFSFLVLHFSPRNEKLKKNENEKFSFSLRPINRRFKILFNVNIFHSSTHRYKIIVYAKTQAQPKLSTAIVSLVVIWFLSVALSFPLYFAMNLEIIKMPDVVVKTIGETSIAYCAEKWGQYEKGRLVVSLFSMLVQVCFF